jgi:soluble lytic murein transglycosylase-like protein
LCLAYGLKAAAANANPNAADQLKSVEQQRQSLDRQRSAVRQQAGLKDDGGTAEGFLLLPALPPLAQADCPALERDEVDALIATAAKKNALPTSLIRAVMRQESAFRPCAISIKGAQGLMQLMPATAFQLHVADPFDPAQNVQGGSAFLKRLLQRYKGDLRLALVAYNAGANRADQLAPAEYPLETQGYLANIFAELEALVQPAPKASSGLAQFSVEPIR